VSADRLLLVEDEERLARNLILNLEAEGHQVLHAPDCAAAQAAVATEAQIDLIILDLMLPDGSGLELAQAWRAGGVLAPILMLTARTATEEVVGGLAAGADDYLGKPFVLEELLVRVAALLRRARMPATASGHRVAFGPNQVDLATGRCRTAAGERDLTALELRLFRHFARKPGQVISREELLREVWEIEEPDKVRTRTIDTFLGRLRKLFETDPAKPRFFRTEHGEGYRFTP
jgi:two-component system alkaline phosphatase synthesis response regulator PhoP